MNVFNDAIEAHAEWKVQLKQKVERGLHIDQGEVANAHVCELGRWIYGEGLQYNRLLSFETMCASHDHFHRAAAEVARLSNAGDKEKALSELKPGGFCAQSSNKLVRAIMDCGRELSPMVVKGAAIMGKVHDILENKGMKEPYTIQSSASVINALRMMVDHNIGALAVFQGQKFLGLFTERGYAQHTVQRGNAALESPVADMIDAENLSVQSDDSIEQCMTWMSTSHKRHLPVTQDGSLIGVISIGDVIKQFSNESRDKQAELEHYIHGHYGAELGETS